VGKSELEIQILDWVQKQGYPLEMKVAHVLRSCQDTFVEQAAYYVDSKTGELREADVVAAWTGKVSFKSGASKNLYVYAVIECKSAGVPWIVFTEPANGELGEDFAFGTLPSVGVKTIERSRLLSYRVLHSPLISGGHNPGYGITQKRDPNKPGGGKDPAYDAVRQVLSATNGVLNDPKRLQEDSISLAIPVVVTNSPLFECFLGSSGDIDIKAVSRSSVMMRNDGDLSYSYVRLVSTVALDDFASDLDETAIAITSSWTSLSSGERDYSEVRPIAVELLRSFGISSNTSIEGEGQSVKENNDGSSGEFL
jgi:hypothetical protein